LTLTSSPSPSAIPICAPRIETAIEPLLSVRRCLVHGDYSPKNLLLLPDGRIWVLDCEVAHFGNPAFDIAFCTNHLLLKSIHLKSPAHLREAGRLWRSYWTQVALPDGAERERDAVRTLAMLMLARVDGKSPVEYLTDEGKRNRPPSAFGGANANSSPMAWTTLRRFGKPSPKR
jgi:aminoglycoside phosphotransferase (APT) family kinase protein